MSTAATGKLIKCSHRGGFGLFLFCFLFLFFHRGCKPLNPSPFHLTSPSPCTETVSETDLPASPLLSECFPSAVVVMWRQVLVCVQASLPPLPSSPSPRCDRKWRVLPCHLCCPAFLCVAADIGSHLSVGTVSGCWTSNGIWPSKSQVSLGTKGFELIEIQNKMQTFPCRAISLATARKVC